MRAAIYTRLSRDESGEGLGVARQREDCEALLHRRGWSLAGVYCDNDLSAFSGRPRPEYRRLVADIREGRLDAVVAWAPERLHRSPTELEEFIRLVDDTRTAVETVKAGTWDVSSSHGRLVARMLGAVSRAESERTGERVARAHQQAKAAGLWRGPIPYGMQTSDEPGKPTSDAAEAAVVEELFSRILQGDALTAIARDLNERGLRPRRGQAWTHTGVLRLVSSPALAGMVLIDGNLAPAAFDGIVSESRWRAAQAAIARRPRGEARRPRESLTLLGGILTCAEHGARLYGGGKQHAAIYGANSSGRCFTSITRAAADEFVTTLVIQRLQQPDARDLLVVPAKQRRGLETEATVLRERQAEIAGLMAEGLLSAATARPKLTSLAEKLGELDARIHAQPFDRAELRDPAASWEAWTMPQRRTAVRALFAELSLHHTDGRNGPRGDPSRIRVTWAT